MVSRSEASKITMEATGENVESVNESSIGRAHETFFIETDKNRYILKASMDEERFQVEAPVMETLSAETKVSVPKLIKFDNSKDRFDFMYFLAEYVDGENIDNFESDDGPKFSYLSKNRKRNLLRSVGEELGKLHSQTSFDLSGSFKSEDNSLSFKDKKEWPELFKEIIIEEQAGNFPERFSDLTSLVEEFLLENLHILDVVEDPCLVHQDLRWPNIKVGRDKVNAILDWEKSISGHHEYDLAKAEQSFLQFKSHKPREKYRKHFFGGYQKYMNIKEGWEKRRRFYRSLRTVESLWTFDGWAGDFGEDRKEELAKAKREELKKNISEFGSSF